MNNLHKEMEEYLAKNYGSLNFRKRAYEIIAKVRDHDSQAVAKNRIRDIKRERAKTIERVLAAVEKVHQQESAGKCGFCQGISRINRNTVEQAIKGVGDE